MTEDTVTGLDAIRHSLEEAETGLSGLAQTLQSPLDEVMQVVQSALEEVRLARSQLDETTTGTE